ncbi:MAG: electron transfer flavoprotein beta subunit [Chloroflexi bacterium]|jgi:electron transfer flavoprotein beta subunit|nr:MAG: electron transfer flavoprotein beta subunit [Chloroflexota bacterium]
MPLNIIVAAKQVLDPEMPASAFKVDRDAKKIMPPQGIPPVVNGFDENAVEAALQLREIHEGKVTVLTMGAEFALDVIKKPLSMGADELILLQDPAFINTPDSFFTATVLAAAIKKIGEYDLIICGRQASDWDSSQVSLGIAEMLGLPVITLGRKIEVGDGKVLVQRVLTDGYEVMEASLPAVVTVSNEFGEPRYPTLRGIMQATRKMPTTWTSADLGVEIPAPQLELSDLFVPERDRQCEYIEGSDEAAIGRNLALKLREAKLI